MADVKPKITHDKGSDLEHFACDGNQAVEFKLVRTVKDLENESIVFHPEMCHQVFNEGEVIFGYENLSIKTYFTAGSLKTYLGVDYKRQVPKALADGIECDDVVGKMKEVLRAGYTESFDQFSAMIEKEEKEFKPMGDLMHNFTIKFNPKKANKEKGAKTNGHAHDVDERCFEIYSSDYISNPKFQEYLKRMESFTLFFIDAATFLDCEENEKWRFFTLFEKYKTSDGHTAYALVGYSSVYQFYVYPDCIRPRVAQMLILPPFQKQGLASHLLSCIYTHYRQNPKVIELTVEDPSDDMECLRDFVDSNDCKKLASYAPEKLRYGFSKEMAEEAHGLLKLTKRQAQRVYEILRLQVTNIHNDDDLRDYRLDVKRRLNIPYQKQKSDIKRIMLRKVSVDPEINKAAALDDSTRKTELESNFQLLLTHYQNIISRLEKYAY